MSEDTCKTCSQLLGVQFRKDTHVENLKFRIIEDKKLLNKIIKNLEAKKIWEQVKYEVERDG